MGLVSGGYASPPCEFAWRIRVPPSLAVRGDREVSRGFRSRLGSTDLSGYCSIEGFQTSHTLPTRSGPGVNVSSPGCQPAGVARLPPDSRTSWNA